MTASRTGKGPGKRASILAQRPAIRRLRVAIAASRFNETVTASLLRAAKDTLVERGVPRKAVVIVQVPGAFELPLAAKWLCRTRRYDVIICLGAVIRGDTPHFDYVARAAADGVMRVGLDEGIPVVFGVLTTDTMAQARARAGRADENRGAEVALTALDMALLARQLAPPR